MSRFIDFFKGWSNILTVSSHLKKRRPDSKNILLSCHLRYVFDKKFLLHDIGTLISYFFHLVNEPPIVFRSFSCKVKDYVDDESG